MDFNDLVQLGLPIVIVGHKCSDGDCLASGLLIQELIKTFCTTKFPIRFLRDHATKKSPDYYKGWEEVNWIDEEDINIPCVCIFVDHQARSLSLLADFDNPNIKKKIFFDHHHRIGIQTDEKDELIHDYKCFSTTHLIYKKYKEQIGKLIDKSLKAKMATWIYAGLYYDFYRFSAGLTPEVLDLIEELRDLGADIKEANLMGYLAYFDKEKSMSIAMRACSKARNMPVVKVDGAKNLGSWKYIDKSKFAKETLFSRLLVMCDVSAVFAIGTSPSGSLVVHLRTFDSEIFDELIIGGPVKKNSHTWVGLSPLEVDVLWRKLQKAYSKLKKSRAAADTKAL